MKPPVQRDGSGPVATAQTCITGGDDSWGSETWVELDLESGPHTVFCYVPSEKQRGRLHIDLGMRTSINIP